LLFTLQVSNNCASFSVWIMGPLSHCVPWILLSIATAQNITLTCPAFGRCVIDCALDNTTCNANGTGTVIIVDARPSADFELKCLESDACAEMLILLPALVLPGHFNDSIHCGAVNSCTEMEVRLHRSTEFQLHCIQDQGDTSDGTICSQILIDGMSGYENEAPLSEQYVTIDCGTVLTAGSDVDVPRCSDITVKGLGETLEADPNTNVTLNIICSMDAGGQDVSQGVEVCDTFTIDAVNAKEVNFTLEGNLKNLFLNASTNSSLTDLTFQLTKAGCIWYTIIDVATASLLGDRFVINASSNLGIWGTAIRGPDSGTIQMLTTGSSSFINSTLFGMYNIFGEGVFTDSYFVTPNVDDNMTVVVTLGYDDGYSVWERNEVYLHGASGSFYFGGGTSGGIYGRNGTFLSVICRASRPDRSCDGLILDIPAPSVLNGTNVSQIHGFLECIGYGCTGITINADNGFSDLAVTASSCDCNLHGANGESGSSCIGQIAVNESGGCDGVTFDGVTCAGGSMPTPSPLEECCGDVAVETHAAVCEAGSPSGLSNGEVVGVLIGVIIAVLLITSLACYCSNQRAVREHVEKQKGNAYSQPLAGGQKKVNLQEAGSKTATKAEQGDGGYGTLSDRL